MKAQIRQESWTFVARSLVSASPKLSLANSRISSASLTNEASCFTVLTPAGNMTTWIASGTSSLFSKNLSSALAFTALVKYKYRVETSKSARQTKSLKVHLNL